MSEPLRRKSGANYDDLRDLADNLVGEIIAGELYATPRPALRHARAASVIGGVLGGPFDWGTDGPGGWVILDEPELHLGGDVMVPDLAGWRRERMPALAEGAWTEVPPDWICEVLSPSTFRLDRMLKLPRYSKYGVGHAWLIDPCERSLEVYRLADGVWDLLETYEGNAKVRAEPFEAIEVDLALLWSLPPESGQNG